MKEKVRVIYRTCGLQCQDEEGKHKFAACRIIWATSHLNSLLQTVPFSPEFRSKYVFCFFCRATCQNWV